MGRISNGHFPILRIVTALCAAACAGQLTPPSNRPVHMADALLTAAEIRHTNAHTAYEAVSYLRPAFLSILEMENRGTLETEPTVVYVNMARAGSLETLELVPASEVVSIQVVKPMHTMIRLGKGHRGGAILVETRR